MTAPRTFPPQSLECVSGEWFPGRTEVLDYPSSSLTWPPTIHGAGTTLGRQHHTMTVDTPAPPAESNTDAPERPTREETNPGRLLVLQGRYRGPGPDNVDDLLRLSAALAKGRSALPYQYRNNPGDILAVMLHANTLDIGITTALDNLVFSDSGVSAMRARLMHALILRAGHEVIVTHHDARLCRMILRRGDGRRGGSAQWTLSEAQQAGLLAKKGSPWLYYGEDMLWARALSRAARRYAADVIQGFYVAEELDGIVPEDDDLDSADLRAAMSDSEGNPVVAPDVEELLGEADIARVQGVEALRELRDHLRAKWNTAKASGLLGAYAGTVDGAALSVRDLLFAWMADVDHRLMEAEKPDSVTPIDLTNLAKEIGTVPTPPATQPETGDAAPAGQGKMSCGCDSAAVLAADGRHQDGCTRPARGGRRG
jgi:hypothetical protein